MADKPAGGLDDTAIAATAPSDPGDTADPAATVPAPRARLVAAGDTLGRYTLDEEVGEGGMATVFRARDTQLRREVAIKILFPHLAKRDEVVRRFQREARAAAGLEHPNILRIYDVGGATGGDPPFIVMELIRGRSLLAEIEQRGPMLSEIVACIGALLADALGAAHAAGIVHRDVKPANVLIAPGGRLLLADFGVARLETEDSLVTKTGAVLGTPAYMSPEQATGDTSTRKSDLYSLGASLYQLATGSLPYSGSPAKVLAAIASGAFVPAVRRRASVGAELSRVIDRLMATDADARPADAAAVATELRAVAVAGGLGEPTDELAAYFEDAAAFVQARTPVVVSALVRAARRAVAEQKLPRAMSLADRASALAPEDPSVTALVSTVTEGGRASTRRRVGAIAAVGAVVIAGGAFGAHALWSSNAAVSPAADAAALVTVPPIALAAPDAAAIDAAMSPPSPDAAVIAAISAPADAAVTTHARADARVAIDAALDAAPAPAPADAAIAADAAVAAPPADGTIVVTNDTWCNLFLDDAPAGRLQLPRATLTHVAAGHHVVRCEQHDQNREWHKPVEVPPGGTASVDGSLLPPLTITIGTRREVHIDGGAAPAPGTLVHLAHGAHRFETTGTVQRLDLSADCTLVDQGDDRGVLTLACVTR